MNTKIETTAERIARQRAARYARDGHPDEIKAAQKHIRALRQKAQDQLADQFFQAVSRRLRSGADVGPEELLKIAQVGTKLLTPVKK